MRVGSLVKRILFTRLFLFFLFLLLFVPLFAFPSEDKGGIKESGDMTPEVLDAVKNIISQFQAPTVSVDAEKLKSGWLSPGDSQPSGPQDGASACQADSRVFYFFSFSMPRESVRLAIEDALRINGRCEKKVVLVLRGLVRNNLKTTIRELYSFMKEIKEQRIEGDWPVAIDPPLFEKYGIVEVPTIVIESKGMVGSLKGDLRIAAALEKFYEKIMDYGRYGSTYAIGEENLLSVLASKQKELEERVQKSIDETKQSLFTLTKYDGQFDRAKEDRVYYLDPSVVLTEDVTGPDGEVLFPKGSTYSPADYLSLDRYVIVDGRDKKQVAYALEGNFKKIILISGDLGVLVRKHGKKFYLANDTIIDKLRIGKVPAVIEQEGRLLRVTEKAL